MIDKLRQIINDGEGLTVEFKLCKSELSNSVFETVSSFSNRYGGYMLLGVEDDGRISGVNPAAASNMRKNFANILNNPNRFAPTLFIALEEAMIDGQTVLWCYIPPNSQVVIFSGKIFDRHAVDGDIDITRNSEMVAHIHRRKSSDYSERKIFPYAKESDFEFDRLMPIVRQLAISHSPKHPWEKMSDKEIMISAGLYENDPITGTSGYNLAAVLLFGRETLIRSCTPNYITDAICRRENIDRYDDRLRVMVNLIDAYDQLMDFIAKHTLDRFFLIDGQSVSVRTIISREIVSNILVHREYTSAFPAKIVIERDRIITENWTLPRSPGQIDPDSFTPYPRNPLLANFFINIGRADVLGSGVRNLYHYTKIYSGGKPELVDGDVFKTIVPLSLSDRFNSVQLSKNGEMSNSTSNKMNDNDVMNDKMNDNDALNDKMNDNDGRSAILKREVLAFDSHVPI
jgi:ATP-dependent DNA helicase RecG